MSRLVITLAVVGLFIADVARGEEGRITMSAGADFSTGDFDLPQDTDTWAYLFSVKYARGPITGKLSVPYFRVEGTGDVIPGSRGVILGPGTGLESTESGLGDVVAAISYTFLPFSRGPFIDLTGKVKFATADEDDGLGTGENDYTVQVDIAQVFGRLTPFGMLGYRFVGEPSGIDLDDVLLASAGLGIRLTSSISVGLVYDFMEAASNFGDDSRELSPYLSVKFGKAMSLNTYGVIGLSDSTPDYGAGFSIDVSW